MINLYSFFFHKYFTLCAFVCSTFFVILVVKRPRDMSASRVPGPGPKSRDPDSLHVVLGSARLDYVLEETTVDEILLQADRKNVCGGARGGGTGRGVEGGRD